MLGAASGDQTQLTPCSASWLSWSFSRQSSPANPATTSLSRLCDRFYDHVIGEADTGSAKVKSYPRNHSHIRTYTTHHIRAKSTASNRAAAQ